MKNFLLMCRPLVLAAMLVIVAVCVSNGDRPSALVGHWVYYDGDTSSKPEDIELFKDGTGVVDKGSITWKVENKRLVFLSASKGLSCNYKVSGYELILAYDDNDSATFVKKERFEEYKNEMMEAPRVLNAYESAFLAAYAENGFGRFTKNDLIFETPTDSFILLVMMRLCVWQWS